MYHLAILPQIIPIDKYKDYFLSLMRMDSTPLAIQNHIILQIWTRRPNTALLGLPIENINEYTNKELLVNGLYGCRLKLNLSLLYVVRLVFSSSVELDDFPDDTSPRVRRERLSCWCSDQDSLRACYPPGCSSSESMVTNDFNDIPTLTCEADFLFSWHWYR